DEDELGAALKATADEGVRHAQVQFTDGNAPGILCAPLSQYANNPTHYALQLGNCVTATITGATDAAQYAVNGQITVFIKSSNFGNATVTGTLSGTTITFTYCAPMTACFTSNVAYGVVGNTTGGTCFGGQGTSGFAYVDASGNEKTTCGFTCP